VGGRAGKSRPPGPKQRVGEGAVAILRRGEAASTEQEVDPRLHRAGVMRRVMEQGQSSNRQARGGAVVPVQGPTDCMAGAVAKLEDVRPSAQ
jgi:hypothetical protein